jgi:O-antigen/teichoic acid export membrane protein
MPDRGVPVAENQPADFAVATVRGAFWTYVSYYTGKGLVFLTTIILARLLSKEDFGVASYAIVTIGFLDVLSDLGIGSALIYHKNNRETLNTGFWGGILIAIALYALTWLSAPFVALFFKDDRAIDVIRLLGLYFPIDALSNVHDSLLRKDLAFGKKSIPQVLRSLFKGITSIAFAWLGYGAYSLIYGQILGTAFSVVCYWWVLKWKPGFSISLHAARKLLSYGVGMVSIDLVAVFLLNADYLFVGRYLGAVALGVYTLSFRIPELLIKQFYTILAKVTFPVYTKMHRDRQSLADGVLITMRYVTMVTIPAALGLAIVARPLVLTFFGQKWADAIPVIAPIAFYTLFRSLTFNIGDVFKATGRVKLLAKISLFQAAIVLPSLWWSVTYFHSIAAVGWTQTCAALLGGTVKMGLANRMLKIPLRTFAKAVEPSLVASAVMCLATWGTLNAMSSMAAVLQLIGSTSVGILAYLAALWVLRREVVMVAGNTLKTAFARR